MKLKKYFLISSIIMCYFIFSTTVMAQTYTVKTVPTVEYKNMVLSTAIEKKKRGRHFKNRMIYVSDNAAYYTIMPYLGYKTDSLLYSYPNVPVFTYLKDFDIIVEKMKDSTKIHSKNEFINQFGYEATDDFKNYHGIQAQKYISKGNFYEMFFWIAEGESSEATNDFMTIMETLGLIKLDSNKRVLAVNYLGSEFPINYIQLSRKSKQNLNRELFENIEISVKAEEEQEKIYEPITNPKDIKHLLNKAFTFDFKRTRSDTDLDSKSNIWKSDTYLNQNNSNRIQFFDDKFFAFIDNFLLQGNVDENGNLVYESSKKKIKNKKEYTLDLSEYKLIYLNKNADSIDFCVQDIHQFWNFMRYTFNTKAKDFKHLSVDLILPNGKTYKGLVKNAVTFSAGYKDTRYEYSTFLSDVEQLDTTKTYVIKE